MSSLIFQKKLLRKMRSKMPTSLMWINLKMFFHAIESIRIFILAIYNIKKEGRFLVDLRRILGTFCPCSPLKVCSFFAYTFLIQSSPGALYPLWPFKRYRAFFWDTLYYIYFYLLRVMVLSTKPILGAVWVLVRHNFFYQGTVLSEMLLSRIRINL